MHIQSRIPKLRDITFDSALLWFSEIEVKELNFLLNELEQGLGHEKMIEAAYPIFMHAFGIQLDA